MNHTNGRFAGDQWFQRIVEGRTRETLQRRHQEFARCHADAENEVLLDYVRQEAKRLGFTPDMGEIIGGNYIASRYQGNWSRVVVAAGLQPHTRQPKLSRRRIYQEEFARQAQIFQQERARAKEQRRAEHQKKSAAAAEAYRQRTERDRQWGAVHCNDTDGMLLDYVRQCAKVLRHTPTEREVVGGAYIHERFGSWAVALYFAELPLPRGMERPKQSALEAYQKGAGHVQHPLP